MGWRFGPTKPNILKPRIWGEAAEPVTLGPDEYFVLGDNTESSADSRYFGPVKGGDVRGVVDVIYRAVR